MNGRLRLRTLPRRLRRGNPGPILPKIAVLIAAALLLRLFFSLLGASGTWMDSIDNDFFRYVLSSEMGTELEESLSVFSRSSYVTGQSAILSGESSYPFRLAPDDSFTGVFPDANDTADPSAGNIDDIDSGVSQNETDDTNPEDSIPVSAGEDGDQLSSVDDDPTVQTVTIKPKSTAGYDYAGGVYIKNETSFDVDVASYLKKDPELDMDADGPLILIVHTHASEAYYPDGKDIYKPTDTERTDDTNYNMIRVGDEMVTHFREHGYEAVHIREIFDYPSYSGSYTRTLEAIEEVLKEYPSIQIVLDVHRDAMVKADGSTYRTVAEIDGKKAAQVLLVMGTSEGGLKHPNWKKNLTLAIGLQRQLSENHPLLMRPINLRPERFNQHATSGSMIVEIGTSSNTLQEALYAGELFTASFCDYLDTLK